MSEKGLDIFFKENAVHGELPSAQAIAHFHMMLGRHPEANEKIQEALGGAVQKAQPAREQETLAEKQDIESAMTSEQIIKLLRRHIDPINQHILIKKAIEFEADTVPEIIRRLKTSLNDSFIEMAVRILANSNTNATKELVDCFDEIKNPYAQSEVMVLLGYKADTTLIPWLIEKHGEFKRRYPNESYCDGAYYALYEIENRFYPARKHNKS
jgi:hypothetical protein